VLHRDDLPLGGFAGLREHRLVMDPKAFGRQVDPGVWPGIGRFVYLSDARFNPGGDTSLHPHREVDVISVMVSGRIVHEGSLEHGQQLRAHDVQVQRAGGEGFIHNEINPDETQNRMIQLWALPETAGEPAGYRLYRPQRGSVTRVYGGSADQHETFAANTVIEVALLNSGQRACHEGAFMAYVTRGSCLSNNGSEFAEGDLLRGDRLDITAATDIHLIVVHTDPLTGLRIGPCAPRDPGY
jgi:redox-sensitive bicupin YhaK (pirin superfamily)